MGPEDFNIDQTTTDVTATPAAPTPVGTPGQLDLLAGMQAKGQPGLTTDYVNAYTPAGMTPEQIAAFNQENAPTTGRLPNEAYFPDLGHNINVGNYSGSEIGSTTLFAPGGGLVPFGMMDAREGAVQAAAAKKAKQVEDFKSKYNAPTTKHTAVQKSLTDNYYSGLNQWRTNAEKKAGGNAALATKMLESDPKFQEWNKGMQDRAKMQDQGVEMVAKLAELDKDPNMVLDPSTRSAMKQFLSGEYAGSDPFSEEGRKFTKNMIAMQGHADLDVKTNEVLNKAIPDIEQIDPTYTSRGKNETATYLEKEYFSEPRMKNLARDTYMSEFQGTGVSEDQVYNMLKSKVGEKVRRKTDTYDKWFKPDAAPAGETDYSSVQPSTTTSFNVEGGKEGPKTIYGEKVYKTTASDEKKELSIPINKDMQDVKGENIKSQTGHIKGTVAGIHIGLYDKNSNRYLTDEEAKKYNSETHKNHNIVQKPVAVVNVTPTTDEKGNVGGQNTVLVDVSEIKGKFRNTKKKSGQQDFDDKITELQQDADKYNSGVKSTAKAGAAKPATTTAKPTGKTKIAGF